MDRFNNILKSKEYISLVKEIENIEKDRIYCLHGIDHFFDTARIAYILALENGAGLDKDIIYAAALLHDIGRYDEYKYGVEHNISSAEKAELILNKCGYNKAEIQNIKDAIISHRKEKNENEFTLSNILYTADKLSRKCFCCSSSDSCKWSDKRKNYDMEY